MTPITITRDSTLPIQPTFIAPPKPNMFASRPIYHTSYTTPLPSRNQPLPSFTNPNQPLPQPPIQSFASTSTSSSSWIETDSGPSSPESYYSNGSTPESSHPITPPTAFLSLSPALPIFPSCSSSSASASTSSSTPFNTSYHPTSSSSFVNTQTTTPIPNSPTTTRQKPTFLGRTKTLPLPPTKSGKPKKAAPKHRHQAVQHSLEIKVERSKGFHSFFVPLARPLPGAPPSSPVFGASSNHLGLSRGPGPANGDYFGCKGKSGDEWVEDVGMGMDLDG